MQALQRPLLTQRRHCAVHVDVPLHSAAVQRSPITNPSLSTLSPLTPFSLFPFFLQVPRDHRQVIQNRELKALLDRVDPGKQGTIPLAAMRKTLTKLLPPPPEKLDRVPAKVCDREGATCTHARTHAERNQ